MIKGYMGKILFVNLSTGELQEETPDDSLYRNFLGGYGIGARIMYDRMKPGVDPLGPDNMLGFATGPLTGSPAIVGTRYQVMAKSPITGGWGDANSGGDFGPYLKFAGYDAVFFTGISDKPVYLFIDNGKAELLDASDLWGKGSYEMETIMKEKYGKDTEVSCIGPSGEKLSLISCVITKRGAAAGRSGIGAVMGSKKLKAVVVRGDMEVPIADREKAMAIRRDQTEATKGMAEGMRKYGTSAMTERSALSGDTPVKNWGGVGVVDMPDASGLAGDLAIANVDKVEPCWHCPIACQSILKEGKGEYKYPAGTRRVEYETQGAFGTNCLNTDAESLSMVNYICNDYGLDTISGGSVVAFAMELYEKGILTKADTDGIDLTWGNHKGIVELTEKIAKREGIGDILADGVKVAAEKIGKGSEEYAVHAGGQELGMHDPKLARPGGTGAARYQMDATPGRHTQGFGPSSFNSHVTNAVGTCFFGGFGPPGGRNWTLEYMQAVTGLDWTADELLKCGERIANIRHCFNLREGINPLKIYVHPRIYGDPPQTEGPLAGVRADIEAQNYWCLGALDWDRDTTKPSKAKLLSLGLDDIAEELHPPQPGPMGPPR
ncbi:MAG TPA: aldehyde ferredoxin oxidoreductase family protein [Dehalococcoidia bacterium]|nr:aldehyde ferredoxin oxidoreductase family protein [Dehalococcoidia bacterium]